jgi:hypothetical protein
LQPEGDLVCSGWQCLFYSTEVTLFAGRQPLFTCVPCTVYLCPGDLSCSPAAISCTQWLATSSCSSCDFCSQADNLCLFSVMTPVLCGDVCSLGQHRELYSDDFRSNSDLRSNSNLSFYKTTCTTCVLPILFTAIQLMYSAACTACTLISLVFNCSYLRLVQLVFNSLSATSYLHRWRCQHGSQSSFNQ